MMRSRIVAIATIFCANTTPCSILAGEDSLAGWRGVFSEEQLAQPPTTSLHGTAKLYFDLYSESGELLIDLYRLGRVVTLVGLHCAPAGESGPRVVTVNVGIVPERFQSKVRLRKDTIKPVSADSACGLSLIHI